MPDPNPSERLAEIEARVEAATEGPWRTKIDTNGVPWLEAKTGSGWTLVLVGDFDVEAADAAFITAARSDIPWLLEREKKLREALNYYAERRNHTTDHDGTPHLWANDSYDDNGPGARARAALADSGEASGEAG